MTTPDLTTYRAVHTALREAASRLAAASGTLRTSDWRRIDAFARYWKGYAGEVLLHHRLEDDSFFPALVERCPVAGELIARTDADHEHLDELMAAVDRSIVGLQRGLGLSDLPELLGQLAAHMDAHLAFEDSDILPLFERHFTGEEYDALEAQAHKELGIGRQAMFTVPFLLRWIEPSLADELVAAAPAPLKVLHRLTRRRHERLTATVLGDLARRTATAPSSSRTQEVAA